ncbi:MAG TPA: hypothetical protein VFX59_24300 [Polyangiales bacterium]|nr:hypothetical protein [Polyangiales bacterium]
MNELHRDPPRWLESDFLSEELASELAAYGAQAPAAASKARMLEQLTQGSAPAAQSAGLLKLKLFVAAAVILAGAVGFLQFARPSPTSMRAPEMMPRVPTRLAPLADVRFAVEPLVRAAPLVRAPVAPSARAPRPPLAQRGIAAAGVRQEVAQAPVADEPDVLAELTMLARARRALLNDPARSLELSEEHARTYPHGTFDEEREVLAIQSLIKLGRRVEARARERAFELRFPRSAQIAHLAKLIANPSE